MDRKWTPCAAQSGEYHAGYEQALKDTAAPDLYGALDRIQDELGCDDPECAMCILARAALAKARGEA